MVLALSAGGLSRGMGETLASGGSLGESSFSGTGSRIPLGFWGAGGMGLGFRRWTYLGIPSESHDSKTVIGPFRAEYFVTRLGAEIPLVIVDEKGTATQSHLVPVAGLIVFPKVSVLVIGAVWTGRLEGSGNRNLVGVDVATRSGTAAHGKRPVACASRLGWIVIGCLVPLVFTGNDPLGRLCPRPTQCDRAK